MTVEEKGVYPSYTHRFGETAAQHANGPHRPLWVEHAEAGSSAQGADFGHLLQDTRTCASPLDLTIARWSRPELGYGYDINMMGNGPNPEPRDVAFDNGIAGVLRRFPASALNKE